MSLHQVKNIDKKFSEQFLSFPRFIPKFFSNKINPKKNPIIFKNSQDLRIKSQVWQPCQWRSNFNMLNLYINYPPSPLNNN